MRDGFDKIDRCARTRIPAKRYVNLLLRAGRGEHANFGSNSQVSKGLPAPSSKTAVSGCVTPARPGCDLDISRLAPRLKAEVVRPAFASIDSLGIEVQMVPSVDGHPTI